MDCAAETFFYVRLFYNLRSVDKESNIEVTCFVQDMNLNVFEFSLNLITGRENVKMAIRKILNHSFVKKYSFVIHADLEFSKGTRSLRMMLLCHLVLRRSH